MSKDNIKGYGRLGNRLYWLIKAIDSTIRWKKVIHEDVKPRESNIYAFWHQKIFFPAVSLHYIEKKITLVSPSRDGELLESVLKKYGYEVIRGSSRDGNIKSLVLMMKALKNGYSLGFAVDGPRGPIFDVKPGIIYMAQKTGAPIVPVGGAFKWKYEFKKAWDKFHLPLPFTKAILCIGKPIDVPKGANPDDYVPIVNDAINEANDRAKALL